MAEEVAASVAPAVAAPAPQKFVIPDTPAPAAASPAPAEAALEGGEKPAPSASAPEKVEAKTDTPEEAEKRGSRRFERKIDKLNRRAAEEKARADFLEKQLSELKPKEAQAEPGAPKLEQFDDIEKYAAARAKFESERTLKSHTEQQRSRAENEQKASLQGRWEEAASSAEDKYPDFADIVGDIQPTTPWAMAIMEAENGPDVAYALGKDLKEAKRISELRSPIAQAVAIGRLSAKLAAEPEKPKKPSQAPAPVAPLSGAAQVDPATPSEKDDMKDWLRKRNKQVHGARAR